MKNFSLNNKNRKWPKVIIIVVIILLILFVINIFVSPIRNSFLKISNSFQNVFWTAGASSSGFLGNLFRVSSLSQENENLKNENQRLIYQIVSLQSIEQGNRAQTEVSLACQNNGLEYIMAGIAGLDKDILSINKGSLDGVTVGMPVINQQNVLVGKILNVYKNFSDIILVSNKNSVINVKVSNPNTLATIDQVIDPLNSSASSTTSIEATPEVIEIDGVVKGSGGLNAFLDLIPVNSEINTNDIILTSALEKSFPKDLLIGKITKKIKNDQEPFQKAQVNLFFDVKTSDNLFVITNFKQIK